MGVMGWCHLSVCVQAFLGGRDAGVRSGGSPALRKGDATRRAETYPEQMVAWLRRRWVVADIMRGPGFPEQLALACVVCKWGAGEENVWRRDLDLSSPGDAAGFSDRFI